MHVERLLGGEADMIHFLGIGAQKAGTTWIYQHLSEHPDIRFPAGKEIHFWDCCRSNGIEWWMGLFADDHQRRKQGEITPAYATLDEATIREISSLLPDLRVFYSLRNPIARAWSSALMALERAEMTIDEASHLWFLDHFKSAGSRRRGDYLSCIRRWQNVFADEQFLTIMFDDITRDPVGVLAMLCRHLGVDANWVGQVPSAKLAMPVFAGPGHDLPEPLLAFLRVLYKPMINQLSELLGRDLSPWLDWDGNRGGG
jgi:Sulfotransferase domain